jgi:N-acetylmuramic acid 6-phosphate etherase
MLSTGAFIRLGKVYKNVMIDFNARACYKLQMRAANIICHLCACDMIVAQDVLHSCDYNVKLAIVVCKKGLSMQDAQRALNECGGRLDKIMG